MTRSRDLSNDQANVGGAVAPFVAGKNKIINGDFGVWQRGTSFSSPATGSYLADRFYVGFDGSPTVTYSRQTFSTGAAPVAGYESTYFLRCAMTAASSTTSWGLYQRIEDVRVFAGQTVTISFWAKADSSRNGNTNFLQEFGSGGSATVFGGAGQNIALTTSWQRFTYTLTLPSISGKTIGTNSSLTWYLTMPISSTSTVDIWGVQVEAGSVATPFTTASGTLQGELALCQRYYQRYVNNSGNYTGVAMGEFNATTSSAHIWQFIVPMRTAPSGSFGTASNYVVEGGGTAYTPTALALAAVTTTTGRIDSTISGAVVGRGARLTMTNTSAYVELNSEL